MRQRPASLCAVLAAALLCVGTPGCGFGDRFTHTGFDGSVGIDSSVPGDAGTDSSIPGCPSPPLGDMDCDGVMDAMDCAPLEPALSTWMLQDELDDLTNIMALSCTWTAMAGFADIESNYPCGMWNEWAFALVSGVPLADVRAETRFNFDGGAGARSVGIALEASGATRSGYYCEVHDDGRVTLQQREPIGGTITSLGTDTSFNVGAGGIEGDEVIDLSVKRIGAQLTCAATFPGGHVSTVSAAATVTYSGQVALTADGAPADFDFIYICGP